MDINKEIKKVQNYFIRKILKGEFSENERDFFRVTILVEGYQFKIWICNGWENITTYNYSFASESSFIQLKFTDDQKKKIFDLLCKKK
jgi:hypothetical protein